MNIGDKVRILSTPYESEHLQPDCVGVVTKVYDSKDMYEVQFTYDEAPFFKNELELI